MATSGTLLAANGNEVGAELGRLRVFGAYLPLLLANAGLLFYVVRVGRAESALGRLLGERWSSPARAAGDIVLGAAVTVLIGGLGFALSLVRGEPADGGAILPRSGLEVAAWCVVALGVGFSEEVVYRGYLQQELGALAGRATRGVALQGVLFGLAHAQQGLEGALRAGIYGLILGAVARLRRSLVPGIIAHVGLDLAAGLARYSQ